MKRNVLVWAETRDAHLRKVSLEALSAAVEIAAGGEVSAVLFEFDESGREATVRHAGLLAEHGADRIYVIRHRCLHPYTTDAHTQALCQLVEAVKPDVLLIGHTAIGKDMAPRVSARLGSGLVSDITSITLDDSGLSFIRPIYAGKALRRVRAVSGLTFATIRPNALEARKTYAGRQPTIVEVAADIEQSRTIVRDVVRKATGTIDLSEAKIVVSGGRGVGSAEGFAALQALADALGGAVGASRGACDAGYCDYALQIGQTGKVVTPDLYIACGISGAIQHVAGMSGAKVIVAINKDPDAPIFKVADYGIVGDLFEVVPLLTKELELRR